MTEIGSTSIRAMMMELLKTKFGGFSIWSKIEADLAILCADLPESTNDEKSAGIIVGLRAIKDFLLEQHISPDEVEFIDEEIERYSETKQISLYVEEDDKVEENVIDKYARLSMGTEGVMGIHLQYNYQQLCKLTNGVYNKTGLIKFYISRERILYGKIVAEIYEHPQKIPIATLIESKQKEKETQEPLFRRIALFGEKIEGRAVNKIKEIEIPFYVYKFTSDKNQELILITTEQQVIGDYIVTGVVTQCDDYRMLTESAKLPTKLPFFFAQSVRNRVIRFKNHKEFKERIKQLGIIQPKLFNYPFTVTKMIEGIRSTFLLKQPEWFKWLIWSWLTHIEMGMFNTYPMHIKMIGNPHSGKSLLLNSLHDKSKETRPVFSGSSSTLKHLVPSFKYSPARLGYLAESNRFSFLDEFLRCLVRTRTTKEGSAREESVAIMNDLLEHQKREAGSGVSRVNVNMTARVIATTNPVRDIHCIEDLINAFEESFLTRWMIYFQTSEHEKMIRSSKDSKLETYDLKLSVNDWISIIDYLQSFQSNYDMNRVEEIYQEVADSNVLSETLKRHYDARHMHHIECIIDGIVKTRCLIEGDMSFEAKDADYKILETIWKNIIKSWIKPEYLKKLPPKDRIFYLPENCQYLYWQMEKLVRPFTRSEAKEVAMKAMNSNEFIEALVILIEMGVFLEDNNLLRPHFLGIENEIQQRLSDRGEDEEVVPGKGKTA